MIDETDVHLMKRVDMNSGKIRHTMDVVIHQSVYLSEHVLPEIAKVINKEEGIVVYKENKMTQWDIFRSRGGKEVVFRERVYGTTITVENQKMLDFINDLSPNDNDPFP